MAAKIPEKLLTWVDSAERLTRTDPRYSIDAFYQMKTMYLSTWLQKQSGNKDIYIWGAGKRSSKRAMILEKFKIKIKGFIDIDPKKIGKKISGKPIISHQSIVDLKSPFILSYVGTRGASRTISQYLQENNFIEGQDFLIVA